MVLAGRKTLNSLLGLEIAQFVDIIIEYIRFFKYSSIYILKPISISTLVCLYGVFDQVKQLIRCLQTVEVWPTFSEIGPTDMSYFERFFGYQVPSSSSVLITVFNLKELSFCHKLKMSNP